MCELNAVAASATVMTVALGYRVVERRLAKYLV